MSTIYVLEDSAGAALYVGCSEDALRRLRDHSKKEWWSQVAHVHFENLADRDLALTREAALIQLRAPRYNGNRGMVRTLDEVRAAKACRIRWLRYHAGLSALELADRAGVNVRTIFRIENGQTQPFPRTAKAIADVLGVEVADLFTQDAREKAAA